MKAVSALDVARAALMEVGADPGRVWESDDTVTERRILRCWEDDLIARKAMRLARIAVNGPDALVRCDTCGPSGVERGTVPCTPVRDVLRGVTCGRAA